MRRKARPCVPSGPAIFTVFYLLIGIGILVEILRRLGLAFVAVTAEEQKAKSAER